MNLREFNALEIGDQVENAMTNGKGTVSEVTEPRSGRVVRVKWGPVSSMAVGPEFSYSVRSTVEFSYPVQSTAWMHWSKVDAGITAEQAEDASKRAT